VGRGERGAARGHSAGRTGEQTDGAQVHLARELGADARIVSLEAECTGQQVFEARDGTRLLQEPIVAAESHLSVNRRLTFEYLGNRDHRVIGCTSQTACRSSSWAMRRSSARQISSHQP